MNYGLKNGLRKQVDGKLDNVYLFMSNIKS